MADQYVLDANVFIQAHRMYYPLDVVPSFWVKIKDLAERGVITSLDAVHKELFKYEDELSRWCEDNLPNEFWKKSEDAIVEYGQVVGWAADQNEHYRPTAIDEFLDGEVADAFLIAYAHADADNRVLVTYEVAGKSKKKIKIPDVCVALKIRVVTPIEMLRSLGETL